MSQALHIFRKDVRYLRIDLSFFIALCVFFAWIRGHVSPVVVLMEPVLELAAVYLIARVIFAESIPGDRQFWLTRPYRRESLAAAKFLFIAVGVCIPIALSQSVMLAEAGFDLIRAIPGLLGTQILLFAVGISVAAIAAIMPGMVPFISVVLIAAFILFSGLATLTFWIPGSISGIPPSVDWVRNFTVGLLITVIAAFVLFVQYRYRGAAFSRIFAVCALNIAGLIYVLFPFSLPLAVQSWFSEAPTLASSVEVVGHYPGGTLSSISQGKKELWKLPIEIDAEGLPTGLHVRSDAAVLHFEWPGGSWTYRSVLGAEYSLRGAGKGTFLVQALMDSELFRRVKNTPMTIQGAVYLTLLGSDAERTISLGRGPENVQDGLRCQLRTDIPQLIVPFCQSAFRWPARLVYIKTEIDPETDLPGNSGISYSPFPSELAIDPFIGRAGLPVAEDKAQIITSKPLAHFRKDFEIRNVRLEEELKPPPILPIGKRP